MGKLCGGGDVEGRAILGWPMPTSCLAYRTSRPLLAEADESQGKLCKMQEDGVLSLSTLMTSAD